MSDFPSIEELTEHELEFCRRNGVDPLRHAAMKEVHTLADYEAAVEFLAATEADETDEAA